MYVLPCPVWYPDVMTLTSQEVVLVLDIWKTTAMEWSAPNMDVGVLRERTPSALAFPTMFVAL